MSEHDDATRIAVLRAQFQEACRRMDEIREDVHKDQAETREMVRAGLARLEARHDALDGRLRAVEREQGQAKERLSTWRLIVPVLSAVAAAVGNAIKDFFVP